jgi:hypothetical protein
MVRRLFGRELPRFCPKVLYGTLCGQPISVRGMAREEIAHLRTDSDLLKVCSGTLSIEVRVAPLELGEGSAEIYRVLRDSQIYPMSVRDTTVVSKSVMVSAKKLPLYASI